MKKPKPPAATRKSRSVSSAGQPDEARQAQIARVVTAPNVPSALVVTNFSKGNFGEVSLRSVLSSLDECADKIKGGDLSRIEAMLGGQAAALNSMFAELARRGAVNLSEYIGAAETYLRLAMKAQSQCRATLETLAAIKNPPIFARQANIAHGPQQVNNEGASVARVENIEKPPTELMGHDHGQRLDTGTARAAIGSNPAVEAVGAIHRTAHVRRKGSRKR